MLTQKPKGTQDIYGVHSYHWHWMEQMIRDVCTKFNATEIRTPTFEHTELFLKNVGETTDIVGKEMYTFNDKKNRSITLRPEGTAGVARCFVENKLYAGTLPLKLYYMASIFRYEQPQAGRFREHHQFGFEFIGSYSPESDVEVICIAKEILEKIGAKTVLHINSIGEAQARQNYHNLLKEYVGKNIDSMCRDCKERFEKNPLRVLDCKEESCKNILIDAPSVLDSLTDEDKAHFEGVLSLLDNLGIEYVVDPRIVRGLDYYTRTVFEFISGDIGAQSTVCGGGRYDKVIEQTGGPATGSVGFGMGMERLLMSAIANARMPEVVPRRDIFIGYIGEKGRLLSQKLTFDLRQKGINADSETMGRGLKAQMKYADKIGSKFSMILGDDEIDKNIAKIKNMNTGEQFDIEIDKIAEFIK